MKQLPLFITGNQNKVDKLQAMIGLAIEHQKVELDEIQSKSIEEVAVHKAKQAYATTCKPVLIEDSGLEFTALGGLPGPFIKFFVEAPDGLEMLCRMLDGFEDRSARAVAVFAYYDGSELKLIKGGLDGVIVDHPRGENGWDWDMIFAPQGYSGRTRAELSEEEDSQTYTIIKPFDELRNFLTHDD